MLKPPGFLDKHRKTGVIYTESELEAMNANESGHEKPV